ncbi:hypothetical protein JTE90_018536 [Oedothorax gibbosus]|uniref:Chitin-binding type-2 domain-containing protein n=1 Tax=Oedothorax gibbosus TaxID=931172 RepID=A0AAV6V6P7_9ARAC|nr:hypothetical protein JTE90_018536 [Oedothorax gibbosus]
MESIRWISLILTVILCHTSSSPIQSALKRVKRWDGTGDMSNMFRGTAGVDYPDYKSIPTTNFRCSDHAKYEGGLYADVDTQCQVYHVCHEGRKDSFLCGQGTVFNQQILACDYWYSTECDTAPSFYHLNSQIGNSGSSWVPPQGENDQRNNQGENSGQNYAHPHNQETNSGQNYPLSSDRGTSYNHNNPQTNFQSGNNPTNYNTGTNDQSGNNPSSYNSETSNQGTEDQYNLGPNPQENNLNRQNGNNAQTDANQEDKSCCCLKNTYKAPWDFPTFPGK